LLSGAVMPCEMQDENENVIASDWKQWLIDEINLMKKESYDQAIEDAIKKVFPISDSSFDTVHSSRIQKSIEQLLKQVVK